jgi:uncharacterized protein
VPHFKQQDYDGGILEGVEFFAKKIADADQVQLTGETETAQQPVRQHAPPVGAGIRILFLILFFVIIVSVSGGRGGGGGLWWLAFLLPGMLGGDSESRGGGGFGSGDGGGFGGFGGGGFGGGGSSGGW